MADIDEIEQRWKRQDRRLAIALVTVLVAVVIFLLVMSYLSDGATGLAGMVIVLAVASTLAIGAHGLSVWLSKRSNREMRLESTLMSIERTVMDTRIDGVKTEAWLESIDRRLKRLEQKP